MNKIFLSLIAMILTVTGMYADDFKITSTDPASGSRVAGFAAQGAGIWKFSSNMDADDNFKAITYYFTDLTTGSKLYTTTATKSSKYSSPTGVWTIKNYSSAITDFKKDHTIQLKIVALDNETPTLAKTIGADSITWIGDGTEEYIYSPATVSISPAVGTELLKKTDNTFTLTFSQPVRLDKNNVYIVTGQSQTSSFQSITANADSTEWTLVAKESTIESTTPQLYINVYGTDKDGKTLEGNNSGSYRMEGKSYYKFKYQCYLGSPALVVEPAAGVVTSLKDFKLSYTGGIDLSYAAGVEDLTVTNAAGEAVATIAYKDKETAYTIDETNHKYVTFSLPTEITTPGKYTLNIPSKMFALGTEFDGYTSKSQTVTYTIQGEALKVASVDPADNSELAKFPELLTVTFNSPDAVAYANYTLVDNNADNTEGNVVFTSEFVKNADNTFTSRAGRWVECKLYTGHTYTLKIKTWGSLDDFNYGNEPSAILDATTWTGTTVPYPYSTVTVESTTPADQAVIKTGDFTVTFSGAVASVTANVNGGLSGETPCTVAAGDDGNKTWKITIPASVIKSATGTLNINIVAKDTEGKNVRGNSYADPDTTYIVNYNCYEGAPEFTITPADGSTVEKIETIQCSYSGKINPAWGWDPGYVEKDGTKVCEFWSSNVSVNADNTVATVTLSSAITEAGTYKVVFPATFFALGEEFAGCSSKEQSVTLTVNSATVINAVQSASMSVSTPTAYNLAGQKVNGAQKGIIIIDGKKVVK